LASTSLVGAKRATFYATGRYHHHLATNTWESRGSARRPGTTTGLAALALTARDSAAFDATAERMIAIGGRLRANSIIAEDPWGNVVELSKT
jgi:catechol 2,3-dioxygenase